MKDLCEEKKFPDLEDDFFINLKNREVNTLMDQNNNVWIRKKLIKKGGFGAVVEFESHNKEYSDLAVKFFIAGKEAEQDMKEEETIVNFFNKHRCKNFLKSGVIETSSIAPDLEFLKKDGMMIFACHYG